ncbi:MAG TPA: D-glycero-beta-D-manno-heptose 1-phosphate adenylyltransferase [Gaiella sp.]|nr:D-glycero-beta-D-manno-heptose 1-phosphate adenylyltransferase [Gaiella sp.]
MTRILVVGDSMLDRDLVGAAERLCPEAPVPVLEEETTRAAPGGAALAASLLARDGYDVVLLTAFGHDEPGVALGDLLADAGVLTVNAGLDGETHEKLRLTTGRHLLCRVDRGNGAPRPAGARTLGLVDDADAVLVSDYGRGLLRDGAVLWALDRARTLVWDPHPRGATPRAGATLVTPNEHEARRVAGAGDAATLAQALLDVWRADAVCVTCGDRGAVLAEGMRPPLTVAVEPVRGDPCGAGDRFAATATALVATGVSLPDAVSAATAEASAFVARSGWHGSARPTGGEDGVVERVRARGGTVVATGGCFDLLHAGHVAMLEAARRLGDCLVVCLNSDVSVRRLKGPDRPLVGEDDRAAVLRALRCVDEVVLFDEETPVLALERLRPDVFVKGADYDAATLPEAAVMSRLGGRVLTVPYVAGRSTTALIERAGVGVR